MNNHSTTLPRTWSVFALLLYLVTFPVSAQSTRKPELSLNENESREVSLTFEVVGRTVLNPEVASVTGLPDPHKVMINGLASGETDVTLTGRAGESYTYRVIVRRDLARFARAITQDLEDSGVVGVEVSENRAMRKVRVTGNVASFRSYQRLKRVLAGYGELVHDLTTFNPTPEAIQRMQKSLTNAGFTVHLGLPPSSGAAAGALYLVPGSDQFILSGKLINEEQRGRVLTVLSTFSWLRQPGAQDQEAADFAIPLVMDLEIKPVQLSIETTFAGVSDSQARQFYVNLAKQGLLFIDGTLARFSGVIGRDRRDNGPNSGFSGEYVIASGMQGSLNFLAASGPGRFRTQGHVRVLSGDRNGASYQEGGTITLQLEGANAVGVEQIDYGLLMNIRATMVDADRVRLNISVELSSPLTLSPLNMQRSRVQTTLVAPLGQTIVLSGAKSLTESHNHTGVPYLRRIPIVNWLFSEKNRVQEDRRVLIMLTPNMVDDTMPPQQRLDLQAADVAEASQVPVEEYRKRREAAARAEAREQRRNRIQQYE